MSKSLRRRVLLWHRWLGLAAVPFVVLLVITGVLLERTDRLKLAEIFVDSEWLLTWYGVTAPNDVISYQAGKHWFSWLAGVLYLDGAPVQVSTRTLIGAARVEPVIVAATTDSLYLFTTDGELIEKVVPIGIDGEIGAIASGSGGTFLIRARKGIFASDIDMAAWRLIAKDDVIWPESRDTPTEFHGAIVQNYRGTGLPWERVLLDLHSGRLLGAAGPYLMDGAAILLLLLSASGVYNWLRRR
jgi:hypothetical protein